MIVKIMPMTAIQRPSPPTVKWMATATGKAATASSHGATYGPASSPMRSPRDPRRPWPAISAASERVEAAPATVGLGDGLGLQGLQEVLHQRPGFDGPGGGAEQRLGRPGVELTAHTDQESLELGLLDHGHAAVLGAVPGRLAGGCVELSGPGVREERQALGQGPQALQEVVQLLGGHDLTGGDGLQVLLHGLAGG